MSTGSSIDTQQHINKLEKSKWIKWNETEENKKDTQTHRRPTKNTTIYERIEIFEIELLSFSAQFDGVRQLQARRNYNTTIICALLRIKTVPNKIRQQNTWKKNLFHSVSYIENSIVICVCSVFTLHENRLNRERKKKFFRRKKEKHCSCVMFYCVAIQRYHRSSTTLVKPSLNNVKTVKK